MSRLTLNYTPDPKAEQILEGIKKNVGFLPNIFKLMAHAPNVLEGYLAFSGALGKGHLSPADREQIALTVAGYDHCQYCASAHTLMAKGAGVSADEARNNLSGNADNARLDAMLKFCLQILKNKGNVSDEDMQSLREFGLGDGEIVEIVAVVCANIFTNYFNHVAETDLDFPKVEL